MKNLEKKRKRKNSGTICFFNRCRLVTAIRLVSTEKRDLFPLREGGVSRALRAQNGVVRRLAAARRGRRAAAESVHADDDVGALVAPATLFCCSSSSSCSAATPFLPRPPVLLQRGPEPRGPRLLPRRRRRRTWRREAASDAPRARLPRRSRHGAACSAPEEVESPYFPSFSSAFVESLADGLGGRYGAGPPALPGPGGGGAAGRAAFPRLF